ncbi:MAG: hypothetical protein NT130_02135 [Candidatus Micrarchaeota archaeon]|nr:hypothetical protein [Candidatus Micrarchaeota archaeon]
MSRLTELLQMFKSRKKLELSEVAKVLGLPEASAMLWARTLKQDNIIDIVQEREKTSLVLLQQEKIHPLTEEKLLAKFPSGEAIPAKELSRLINEYAEKIEEMKKKSAELRNIEKEKSDILYKDYVPLERRFEVELHLVNEHLAEKENIIKDLEGRIREVPRRISLIEANATKLEKIESYIHSNLEKSRVGIEKEVDRIEEIRSLVDKYTSEVNRRIQDQLSSMRNVQKELARLKKMEDWIYLQQDMLEKNMKDYSHMRKQSLDELEELRDLMRAGFLKKYEKELRKMREAHLEETEKIKAREREFQARINAETKDLEKLTEESDKIVKAFELLSKKKLTLEEGSEEKETFVGELERLPPAWIE